MATPLTAPHRVRIPYDVPGLPTHNIHFLCSATPDDSDPTKWALLGRAPANIGFQIAMNYLMPLFLDLFDAATDVGSPVLEAFTSGAYSPVAVALSGGPGTAGGAFVPAQQSSFTYRIVAPLETVRIQVMEPSNSRVGYYGKFVDETAIPNPQVKAFAGAFTDNANTTSAYQWVQNRGAHYILGFLSFVQDQNEKMKRKRGGS